MRKFIIFAAMALLPPAALPQNRSDEAVWKDFTAALVSGKITADRIKPYYPNLLQPILGFLDIFRKNARPEDWKAAPELFHVGNQLHGIIRLSEPNDRKVPYCFSLLLEDSSWYFQHVEGIFIRLDKLGPLPASRFPDLDEGQKAWMRDEGRTSEQVRLFNFLVKEKGRKAALDWFRDGAGYALAARTWVPFVEPREAFVLYLCWDQANLYVNPATLEALDDDSARVRLQPRWFRLYKRTGHLRPMISPEDYRAIFETTWADRAAQAGWKLEIEYAGDDAVFRLKR